MAKSKGKWHRDLESMRTGQMSLGEFVALHRPLIEQQIAYWARRRPAASVCRDDIWQEALLAIWQAGKTWRPGTGWALSTWTKQQVRWHLQKCNRRFLHANVRVEQYMDSILVEDRFVWVESDDGTTPAVEPPTDEMIDAWTRAVNVVRQLRQLSPSSPKKAEVVAHVLLGESLDAAVMHVHGSRCRAPRKAGLRAIAAAHGLMEA